MGSSAVIASTGPKAFITYATTGLIAALMMRMLGEMAAAQEYLADTDHNAFRTEAFDVPEISRNVAALNERLRISILAPLRTDSV